MTAAAVRAEYVALTPLGRIEEPEDVADVVVFLASDLARFMTGEAVCVTGGAWWIEDCIVSRQSSAPTDRPNINS